MSRQLDNTLAVKLHEMEIDAARRSERAIVTKEILVTLLRGGLICGIRAKIVLDDSTWLTADQLADVLDTP